jgi:hypothetical protein
VLVPASEDLDDSDLLFPNARFGLIRRIGESFSGLGFQTIQTIQTLFFLASGIALDPLDSLDPVF